MDSNKEVTFDYYDLSNVIKRFLVPDGEKVGQPYFAYILQRLDREISTTIETACIIPSEAKILFNPIFMSRLSKNKNDGEDQQMGILIHEILHEANFHFSRFAKEKWEDPLLQPFINIACDCAIDQFNPQLKEFRKDFLNDIKESLGNNWKEKETAEYYYKHLQNTDMFKQMKKYKKWAEEVTDEFNKEQEESQQGNESKDGDKGNGNGNGNSGGNELTEEEKFKKAYKDHLYKMKKELENGQSSHNKNRGVFKEILAKAREEQENFERRRGIGAGDSLLNIIPKDVDIHKQIWDKLIEKSFGEEPIADTDFLYGRASRRNLNSYWYSRHNMQKTSVYVGIDTSASVTERQLTRFVGYIKKGMKKHNCEITLIQCDYDISDVSKVRKISKSGIKMIGRGGTDMTKILDYIEETEKNPRNARLILLTDGYTPWRESKVKTSVVYTKNYSEIKPIYNSAIIGE